MLLHPKNLKSENNNPWFKPWFNILLHTQLIVCATVESQCLEYLGCITLSSGTTGLPKGICHSHWSALHFMGYAKTFNTFGAPSVATTCFFHVGGFLTGTLSLECRNTFNHVSKSPFHLPRDDILGWYFGMIFWYDILVWYFGMILFDDLRTVEVKNGLETCLRSWFTQSLTL